MDHGNSQAEADQKAYPAQPRSLRAGLGLEMGASNASRMSARNLVRERIERLQREIAGLEALYRALPLELPPEADETLWSLLVGR